MTENPSEPFYGAVESQPLMVGPGQALRPAQGLSQPIIVVQQTPARTKFDTGQIVAMAAGGVVLVGVLLAVAVVAVAVAVGAISCALGWLVIKSLMGDSKEPRGLTKK